MGTWGPGILQNDSALDFVDVIVKANDLSAVEQSISLVLSIGEGYLEAPLAEEAIVASSIVARLLGRYAVENKKPNKFDAWIEECPVKPDESLILNARQVLERIQTEPSELLALWKKSPHFDTWKHNISTLRQGL
jgi:hypothetical protein